MRVECNAKRVRCVVVFFFNDTATTEIYTLSLHDALPIWASRSMRPSGTKAESKRAVFCCRSEEHTSELQSLRHLVCRLLLEKIIKLGSSAVHGGQHVGKKSSRTTVRC